MEQKHSEEFSRCFSTRQGMYEFLSFYFLFSFKWNKGSEETNEMTQVSKKKMKTNKRNIWFVKYTCPFYLLY